MCETYDQINCQNSLIVNKMIDKIANKQNVYFKSQQKDETDLTVTDKHKIVSNVFDTNKQQFLQRYGQQLSEDELKLFDDYRDNNDIQCILKSLRETNERSRRKSIVKNRRYAALQQLIQKGDYFSDVQMQDRNPSLFQQMIGQHMTDEEKTKLTNDKYLQNHERITLSSFLLEQMDNNRNEDKLQSQEVEEFDSDSEEESDDQIDDAIHTNKCLEESEKQKLREEFTKYMSEQFLAGNDSEFYDYKECDQNSDLDLNQIQERDIEDKYFDED